MWLRVPLCFRSSYQRGAAMYHEFRKRGTIAAPKGSKGGHMKPSRLVATAAATLLAASLASPSIADVISDWSTAVVPPAPELKEVTVDPSTTALLFLDMMKANCNARPRCVAIVPNLKRLHDAARAHNMVVWYSLVGSNGKATPDDVVDPAIKPRDREVPRIDTRADPQGSRHQDRDHLRQLVPGRDRRHGAGGGAAQLQDHRAGRLLGGRGRVSRAIRSLSSRQGQLGRGHQQRDLNAQHDDEVLRSSASLCLRSAARGANQTSR